MKDTTVPVDNRRDIEMMTDMLIRKRDIEVSRMFKWWLTAIQTVAIVGAVLMNLWYAENLRVRLFGEGLAPQEVRNVFQDMTTQHALISALVVLGFILAVRILCNLVIMGIVYLTYKEKK